MYDIFSLVFGACSPLSNQDGPTMPPPPLVRTGGILKDLCRRRQCYKSNKNSSLTRIRELEVDTTSRSALRVHPCQDRRSPLRATSLVRQRRHGKTSRNIEEARCMHAIPQAASDRRVQMNHAGQGIGLCGLYTAESNPHLPAEPLASPYAPRRPHCRPLGHD